ncbi:1717_t:CDS:1, partial [Paraglomus occultum]
MPNTVFSMKRHRKIVPNQSPNNYSPGCQPLSNQSQTETSTTIEDVFEEQDAGNAMYGPECWEQNDVYEEYTNSSLLYSRCRLMTPGEKLSWKYDKSKYLILSSIRIHITVLTCICITILDVQPELRFRPPLGSSLADNRRYVTDDYGHIPVWSESYTRRAGDDHGYGTE